MTEAVITIEDIPSPTPDKIFKIIHVAGQLDESNVDTKIQEIYKIVETNPKGLNLIFDLSNLEYMNSKSIGYLTDLYGKITELGGQVAISNAKSNILDILQVVGLTQLIKTFTTLEEAKSHLTSGIATPVVTAPTSVTMAPPATTTSTPPPIESQPATPVTPAAVEAPTTTVVPEAPTPPPATPQSGSITL